MGQSRKLDEIVSRLETEPLGPERLALFDRGIAEAAVLGDEGAGFELREGLLYTCMLMGRLDKGIPAIEWCLGRCDAGAFDVKRVLFQYKWVLEELPRHSEFSRETIEQGLDDFEARSRSAGWGPRGAALLRVLTNLTMADGDAARPHVGVWQGAARDEGSDCEACEAGHLVRWRLVDEDYEGAMEAAAPVLDGRLECEEEPALTLSRVPHALLALGRPEEAFEMMGRALEAVAEGGAYAEARARLMQMLLITGNVEAAARLLEISLPQVVAGGNELNLMQTCVMGTTILEVLRRRGIEAPALETPRGDAEAWMRAQVERLVPAFDRRNGNGFYGEHWQTARKLVEALSEGE